MSRLLAEDRAPVAVGECLELRCERIVHLGRGLAHHRGQVVFLFGAVPGELVRARVTERRPSYLRADVEEVLAPAPGRVDPPCPLFGECGGCQLQHLEYPQQLAVKREVLLAELRARGLEPPGELEVLGAASPYGYRWRGEFHRGPDGTLGFKSRSGYQTVPVFRCAIHADEINSALRSVGAALADEAPTVQTVSITRVEEGLLLQTRPDVHAGPRVALAAAGPGIPLVGTESGSLPYGGRSFRVTASSFIQLNQRTLPQLYETVVGWLADEVAGKLVVDAYAGTGVLSVRLVDLGAQVVAVESGAAAARLAALHAEMYAGGRMVVRRGDVEAVLPELSGCHAIVLDPPRSGLSPGVRGWLGLAGPPVMVYLSCDVAALGRDLETLCRLGPYRLERLRLVDMFPQTYHFEVAVLLRRW